MTIAKKRLNPIYWLMLGIAASLLCASGCQKENATAVPTVASIEESAQPKLPVTKLFVGNQEIDSEVADGPQAVILPQVTFGIAVRMAVLTILAGN